MRIDMHSHTMSKILGFFMSAVLAFSLFPAGAIAEEASAQTSGGDADDEAIIVDGPEDAGAPGDVVVDESGVFASDADAGVSEPASDDPSMGESEGDDVVAVDSHTPEEADSEASSAPSDTDIALEEAEQDDADLTDEQQEEDEDDADDEVVSVEEAERITGISAALEGIEYASGEVIVSFDYGTTLSEADDAVAETEAVAAEEVSGDELLATDVESGELVSSLGFEPMAVVSVEEGLTVVQAIVEMQEEPNVVSVEPNYFLFLADDEYDQADAFPPLEEQGVKVNDAQQADQWGLKRVGIFNAWSLSQCNNRVGIAIIDTGCNTAHPDLALNIVATYNATNRTSDVTDSDGHGTHVAGIAAGVANNAVGVAGSSYNANLVIIKATDADGTFNTASIMRAYDYINYLNSTTDCNIRVVNMSLGANLSANPNYDWGKDVYRVAGCIEQARGNGILTVCAAGNKQSSASYYPTYPGDYEGCLSVMNLNADNVLDSTSNSNVGNTFGVANATKDVCAPGTGIISTTNDGGYGYMTGTSMAAPMVSGVAALCFAANPSLGPDEVMGYLESTAKQPDGSTGWTQLYGYGCIDANAALWSVTGQQIVPVPEAISIEGAEISPIADQQWAADGVEPALTVTLNGAKLEEGTDYRLQYFDNYEAGTGSVCIEGIGAYTGSLTKTFVIRGNLAEAKVSVSPASIAYDGKAKTPAVTVKFDGKTLSPGVDYTVVYSNNTAIGAATATVTGKGSYLGKKSAKFTIAGSLANATVTLSATAFTYNGQVKQPGVTVKLAGMTLKDGVDYTTTYTSNKLVGTGKVTVRGKGAFSGSNVKTFTIIPAKTTLASATKVSAGVQLKWSKAPGATSYEVQRQTGSGAWAKVATVSGTSYVDAGVPGKKANYRVISVATSGGKTYKSGASAVKSVTLPAATVTYRVNLYGKGWQAWKSNGATGGTTGKSLYARAMQVKLSSKPYSGGISYRTYMQNKGWQAWQSNGSTSGLASGKLRVEAVQLKLTGEMAKKYDLYYRVDCQKFGWSGWAKNGASAGTSGYGYRIDAMQVKLVPKGSKAPGSTANAFRKK